MCGELGCEHGERYVQVRAFDRGVAPHTYCVSREGVFPQGWGGGRGESVLSASCSVVLWW